MYVSHVDSSTLTFSLSFIHNKQTQIITTGCRLYKSNVSQYSNLKKKIHTNGRKIKHPHSRTQQNKYTPRFTYTVVFETGDIGGLSSTRPSLFTDRTTPDTRWSHLCKIVTPSNVHTLNLPSTIYILSNLRTFDKFT